MSKGKSYCPYDDPDCFKCPFSDCKASLTDINRQRASEHKRVLEKRNREIADAYLQGASTDGLAERYGMNRGTITAILNKEGIQIRRKRKKDKIIEAPEELLYCKNCIHAKVRPDIRSSFWFCWKHRKYITECTVINRCEDFTESEESNG